MKRCCPTFWVSIPRVYYATSLQRAIQNVATREPHRGSPPAVERCSRAVPRGWFDRRNMKPSTFWLAAAVAVAVLADPGRTAAESFKRGAVATIQPLATQAGVRALADGGNAVDAAVAAALMLAVVDGHDSGLGGGCFLLARLSDGRFIALDGREAAPAAANHDLFLRDGKAVAALSQEGALAVGIPGEVATLAQASANFGRLPFARLLESAAQTAEKGFSLNHTYAARLRESGAALARFSASREVFLKPDGSPWLAGDSLVQRDLAGTLRELAAKGPNWFYKGAFAERAANWITKHGGLATRADFAAYAPRSRTPVRGQYRGYEIVSFPPPSSGGVHVIEILNLLERFDLRALGDTSPEFIHLVAEAMKLAFADRAQWLGDPDFAPVPRGLISRDYAGQRSAQIDPQRASAAAAAGMPPDAATDVFERERRRHTTHFSTVDVEGNWVSITATINTSFGSKVTVPGTGVLLNNQMDDFAAQPGVPNFFGLVGAEANSVAGGKRPLSSMSPTLVLKDGKPILALGAAGGPTIISQTVLAILRTIDFGLPVEAALARPRFHHQWRPDELRVERSVGAATVARLRALGHRVVEVDSMGAAQAVGLSPAGAGFVGAADPRSEGSAGGL